MTQRTQSIALVCGRWLWSKSWASCAPPFARWAFTTRPSTAGSGRGAVRTVAAAPERAPLAAVGQRHESCGRAARGHVRPRPARLGSRPSWLDQSRAASGSRAMASGECSSATGCIPGPNVWAPGRQLRGRGRTGARGHATRAPPRRLRTKRAGAGRMLPRWPPLGGYAHGLAVHRDRYAPHSMRGRLGLHPGRAAHDAAKPVGPLDLAVGSSRRLRSGRPRLAAGARDDGQRL